MFVSLSSECSMLSSQLELQIIPIEQNRTLSAMSVAGTLGKMSTQILVVRCLVISLKSQMLNTNIKSSDWSKSGYNTRLLRR